MLREQRFEPETEDGERPTMTVLEAERAADSTLARFWWLTAEEDLPLPVEPTEIAATMGIVVRAVALPPDESGNLVVAPGVSPLITVNRHDSRSRQRFTCAHEIGHYRRHLDNGDLQRAQTYVDRRAQLAAAGTDTEEIYANQFAAALLMPARLVQRLRVQEGLPTDVLARLFGTSEQAMGLRLRNLDLS